MHWGRLIKNIGETQILGVNVVETDKCLGISQLLGGDERRAALPKSMPMYLRLQLNNRVPYATQKRH